MHVCVVPTLEKKTSILIGLVLYYFFIKSVQHLISNHLSAIKNTSNTHFMLFENLLQIGFCKLLE